MRSLAFLVLIALLEGRFPSLESPAYAMPSPARTPTATATPAATPTSTPADRLTPTPTEVATSTSQLSARRSGDKASRREQSIPVAEPIQEPIPEPESDLTLAWSEEPEPVPEPLEQADALEETSWTTYQADALTGANWTAYQAPAIRQLASLSPHVLSYLGHVLGAAEEVGVDPAVLAALMELEGSGETAVSPAGAAGLMQLMPENLLERDDPFGPATNILRAAELVRRLTWAFDGDLAAVAGAYFGAVDDDGSITDDSDGITTGIEYVSRFAEAYARWAEAFSQPARTVAIRPIIRQRPAASAFEATKSDASVDEQSGPGRDQWYLYPTGALPLAPSTMSSVSLPLAAL